ncbi:MAG: HD-GYP domain-containing protein [Huintestinicola sp.]
MSENVDESREMKYNTNVPILSLRIIYQEKTGDIMEILNTCKLQIACLVLLMYVGLLFIKQGNKLNKRMGRELCNKQFDMLFIIGEATVVFDGITAYTVNHMDSVPELVNDAAHFIFMLLLDCVICTHFLYWLDETDSMPQKRSIRFMYTLPAWILGTITAFTMPMIEYRTGTYSNYSMGVPVYASFVCIGFYSIITVALFLRKGVYLEKDKKTSFIMAMAAVLVITAMQMLSGESLFGSLAYVLIIISIYLLMENPTVKESNEYHKEMIMGFATLIENKDNNTGGHIRRTSIYAEIIAGELRKDPRFTDMITKDYMENLKLSAPMHDIGKISIPDSILNKPGKLTDEEYEIMKTHSEVGGRIITETFGHMMDDDYKEMAYQVAYHHHEKWNGRGYPDGIGGDRIPLCARIMAVADVFDAVSAKRCYRDALPVSTCFEIISKGRNTDFDPDVVDAFMACRDRIEEIAKSVNSEE